MKLTELIERYLPILIEHLYNFFSGNSALEKAREQVKEDINVKEEKVRHLEEAVEESKSKIVEGKTKLTWLKKELEEAVETKELNDAEIKDLFK